MKSERKIVQENKTAQLSTSRRGMAEPEADRHHVISEVTHSLETERKPQCGGLTISSSLWRRIFISPSIYKGHTATGTSLGLVFPGCFWSPWKKTDASRLQLQEQKLNSCP